MARPSIAAQTRRRPRAVGGSRRSIGERTTHIEGRFRRITVHQLALAWWLFKSGTITKRQLRVYFAAHELDERRAYAIDADQPLYTLRELARLVGGAARGRDSSTGGSGGGVDAPSPSAESRARAKLRSDIRALHRVGLVSLGRHEITFAVSADQIKPAMLRADLGGYWAFFGAMPNRRRTVPVPRRTLRALAAGLSTNAMALMIALLIRGLFWHRDGGSQDRTMNPRSGGGAATRGPRGDYRVDGRYKLAWVAEHFGISRRGATDARAKLIELGWLEPLPVNQWMMNKWGLHDRIVTGWSMSNTLNQDSRVEDAAEDDQCAAVGEARPAGANAGGMPAPYDPQSATRQAEIDPGSASPDQTDLLSLSGEQKTRTLRSREAERDGTGVSREKISYGERRDRKGVRCSDSPISVPQSGRRIGPKTGSRTIAANSGSGGQRGTRRAAKPAANGVAPPNIRDVRDADLRDTHRLLELYRQACTIGLAKPSEVGRMEFFALAERARSRGKRPGAMFYWLIREQKTAFITLHDEDEAARRLREHLNGRPARAERELEGVGGVVRPKPIPDYTRDQTFVLACVRVAKQHRGVEAFTIARAKGWDLERFEAVQAELDRMDLERWRARDGQQDL